MDNKETLVTLKQIQNEIISMMNILEKEFFIVKTKINEIIEEKENEL